MNLIAQELQIYQLLEAANPTDEILSNILELYQIQINGTSYLMIKEPYDATLCNVFIQMSTQEQLHLMKKLRELLIPLLKMLAT